MSLEHATDKFHIEPITPPKPINFKTERQLAAYLAKIYGEVPVYGGDLAAVFNVATDDYLTEAEQRAHIESEVACFLPDPEPAETPATEWNARCARAAQTHVRKIDSFEITERPAWADEDRDWLGERAEISAYQSRALIATTLSRISGIKEAAALKPAYFRLQLTRFLFDKEPVIELGRFEQLDNDSHKLQLNSGTRTQLTAREATDLAHSLLAAVDLISATGDVE